MVTMAFLADDRYHAILPDHVVLGFIAGIEMQRLTIVPILNERFYDIRIVDVGIRGGVFLNEFGLLVCLGIKLIAIVRFIAPLAVAGIRVLVTLLVEPAR